MAAFCSPMPMRYLALAGAVPTTVSPAIATTPAATMERTICFNGVGPLVASNVFSIGRFAGRLAASASTHIDTTRSRRYRGSRNRGTEGSNPSPSVSATPPPAREQRGRRVRARTQVHTAARMRRCGAEIEPAHGRLGPAEPRHRAEDQLLVELRRPAVDGAADEVRVARLELVRPGDVARQDQVAEARSEPLDLGLHALDEAVELRPVPAALQLAARVAAGALRHVRVRPRGLRPLGRARGVGARVLAEDQERPRRDPLQLEVDRDLGQPIHAV